MTDEYGFEPPAADDYAAMLASLDGRIERATLARALGVKTSELELISIGHAPKPGTAKRLRAVYALSQQAEGKIDDELVKSLDSDSGVMIPLSLLPRLKTYVVAFVVVDALVFGALLVYVALRG
jgi:hypothetical protein